MGKFIPVVSSKGWASLPVPGDASAREGWFLHSTYLVRDFADPDFEDRRIVQIRSHTPPDEPEAVTLSLDRADVRELAHALLQIADGMPSPIRVPLWMTVVFFTIMAAIGAGGAFAEMAMS